MRTPGSAKLAALRNRLTLTTPTLLACCMHVAKFLLEMRALRTIRHVCYAFAELMLSIA